MIICYWHLAFNFQLIWSYFLLCICLTYFLLRQLNIRCTCYRILHERDSHMVCLLRFNIFRSLCLLDPAFLECLNFVARCRIKIRHSSPLRWQTNWISSFKWSFFKISKDFLLLRSPIFFILFGYFCSCQFIIYSV